MSDLDGLPAEYFDLIDEYCSGFISDHDLRRLEAHLLANAQALRVFVAYFQMHTDLRFAVRARRATSAVLETVVHGRGPSAMRDGCPSPFWGAPARLNRWLMVVAALLIAAVGYGVGHWSGPLARLSKVPSDRGTGRPRTANVAWLVNAQDCQWDSEGAGVPGRDMRAGKVLRLRRGLVEIEFDRGARLILQGPAGLELISGNAARLVYGTLTARVPQRARGFTVYSPQGKVVDLGTEFGLSVDERGATAVRVFEGTVEASPTKGDVTGSALTLHEYQTARIDGRTVALSPSAPGDDDPRYVREIVPPPIITPRTREIRFTTPAEGTLRDIEGRGVGLTDRLPGTGGSLAPLDPNLRLNTRRGALELTTTRSDINTQQGMAEGEYLGCRLADLGFTGTEDFAVSVTIPQIPGLASVGQFGLYAGARSDKNIRGGLISQPEPDRYLLFLVNNNGGRDSDLYEVGLITTGEDLRLTLRRIAGAYSLVVENLTRHSSSTLAIAHPAFLNDERNLYVGLFGANTQSDMRKTLTIREFGVKVWTVSTAKGFATNAPERADQAAQ